MRNVNVLNSLTEAKFEIMVSQDDLNQRLAETDKKVKELVDKTAKSIQQDFVTTKSELKQHTLEMISVPELFGTKNDKYDSLGELMTDLYETSFKITKDVNQTLA